MKKKVEIKEMKKTKKSVPTKKSILKEKLKQLKNVNRKKLFNIVLYIVLFFSVEGILLNHFQVPIIKSGDEVVAEVDGKKLSATELYTILKEKNGIDTIVAEMDQFVLNDMYPTTDEMTAEIDEYVEYFKVQTGEEFLEYIAYYGYGNTEEDFRKYVENDYKKTAMIEDYADTILSSDDIEEYYKKEADGDVEVSHILIAPETTEGMTEEDIADAEGVALATATKVINKLKDGEMFGDLASEYSDDASNSQNGGELGFISKDGNMVKEFEDAAFELEVDHYSKSPVKTQFGYHIILKTNEKEKGELADIEDSIKIILRTRIIEQNNNISNEAMINLYDKYDFKLFDSRLKSDYNALKEQMLISE